MFLRRPKRDRFSPRAPLDHRMLRFESMEDRLLLSIAKIDSGKLVVSDPAGDANAIAFALDSSGSSVLVSDSASSISAGTGATVVDAHTVSVPLGFSAIEVRLAAGDDSLSIASL